VVNNLASIYVWLRYSSARKLTWQRNYNTQPRILGDAQKRLTNSIAEVHSLTFILDGSQVSRMRRLGVSLAVDVSPLPLLSEPLQGRFHVPSTTLPSPKLTGRMSSISSCFTRTATTGKRSTSPRPQHPNPIPPPLSPV